jgi:multiple sugar transport system permease protein
MNRPNQVPQFIGFENYARVFTDELLLTSTYNTVVFAVVSVLLELILGLIVAMVICGDSKGARIAMSIFIIPMIMAPVAAGTLWRMMLDSATGVINYFLTFVGIPSVSWLAHPNTAMIAVIMVNVWQLTPWCTVILAAGLKALPSDCLQAALVDGASRWQIFWRIIFPLIRPLLIVVMMIRFIDAFKVFDTIYVMTGGGPGTATEMLPNYIYRQGLRFFDAGYAATLAVMFVLVMSVCSVIFIRWRKRAEVDI